LAFLMMERIPPFLRRLLVPPDVGGGPELARLTRLVHTALVVGIAIDLIAGPPVASLLSPWPELALALNGLLLVVFVGLLILTRHGRARLAAWLLILVLWLYQSAMLWWFGGLRTPGIVTFFAVVLMAALFLGPRGSVVALVLSVAASLAVLLAEKAGLLPAVQAPSAVLIWVLLLINLFAVVVLAHLAFAELRRANLSLQAEIDERRREEETRRRLEEQLRQSQKLEAVGRLAGGVAHDFNNLLMVITGHGELLRRGLEAEDPRRRKLNQMMSAADRASRLVRQLLAFSRSQALEPQRVDLDALVSEAARMLRPLMGSNISLETRLQASPRQVWIDPAKIEQVIMNLALNARDAMPDGGRLDIGTESRDVDDAGAASPGRYVVLSVRDTGAGMDAQTRSRVFEPFFTTKSSGQRTGLGLAMAYGIVQQSGGHIAVESERGHGTAFHIHLPLLDADADSGPAEEPPAEGARGQETILVVEDEESIRELARELLAGLGYGVLCAESGETALAAAERHSGPIHLVLADVVMPGLEAPDLVARLRETRPSTRALYMSGHSGPELASHGFDEGRPDFLPKPFGRDLLARRVREILDRPLSV
jgi:signal transduction histidine kinase